MVISGILVFDFRTVELNLFRSQMYTKMLLLGRIFKGSEVISQEPVLSLERAGFEQSRCTELPVHSPRPWLRLSYSKTV